MAGGDRRSGIARLFAAGLIGAGAGLLAGGRAVKTYDWRTECEDRGYELRRILLLRGCVNRPSVDASS